jgi:hypothetical protein
MMTLPELCVGYPNPSSVSSAIEQAKSDDLTKAKLRAMCLYKQILKSLAISPSWSRAGWFHRAL